MLTARMTRRQGHDVRAGSASLGLPPSPPSPPSSFSSFSSSSNPFSRNLTLPTDPNIFQVLPFFSFSYPSTPPTSISRFRPFHLFWQSCRLSNFHPEINFTQTKACKNASILPFQFINEKKVALPRLFCSSLTNRRYIVYKYTSFMDISALPAKFCNSYNKS